MSKEEKSLLFISHAVPQDDYLAVWLASKLKLLGYDVWVDKKDLRSGSAFWNEIELKMRDQSIKFLALVSQPYIDKSRDRNSGVFSEVTLAKALSKKIENYIIPLKVDDCSYDDFPINILPLDTIDFSKNWGFGLKKLIKELEIQNIPKSRNEKENVLSLWHRYQEIKGEVIEQSETYGSNWFLTTLPKTISVYKFAGEPKSIYSEIPFPVIRNEDYYIGFFDDHQLYLRTEFKEEISTEEFLAHNEIELKNGDRILDTEPKFVALMNKSIYDYFYHNDDFKAFPISNKKLVIYPINTNSKSGYVSFVRNGKKGRRMLKGRKPVNWSFGLSFVFQLEPYPHFVANHHILSSDENGFFDKDKRRDYRRSIASGWFNRDWFERILAFMALASNDYENNVISVNPGREIFKINLNTLSFSSDYGYTET
ncbi:toll/interleukin-1 receptor domain-containing protein [Ulvibacterium marinum]|uniref:toll/interleukin-1 receptor domain-containing protein n=1 Tax=Ulvibacterium marinum TaxID=2419782 RepID=UPI0024944FEF|nr:toll/interleukin-1 receptor domain-containing protein [Ulvibacterium marinum]